MKHLLLPLFFLLTNLVSAQPSLFDALHERGDTIDLRVETDWKKLIRNRRDKKWWPATFHLTAGDTTRVLPGKIRSRGNIRLEVCQNPSLKVKFKKKALLAAGFSDLNDWKIVLQCSSTANGEQYLLREQFVYALHQVFSEHTHRLVPARLQPCTKENDQKDEIKAFLIESEEQLCARYEKGRVLATKTASTHSLDRESYVNMCLFNYLVLNTDWAVFNLHNVEIIQPGNAESLIPIPYDFDYSGFVNTSYAVPQEQLDLTSVHLPYWLGHHVTEAEIRAGAAHFLARRDAATALLNDHPRLSNYDRKRLTKRLEVFFELMADERKLFRLIR
jgi:hypothetical protein